MITLQQLMALIIIAFFVYRLCQQKNKKQVSSNEFYLWLTFWIGSGLAILFLKELDKIASTLGFSASGINLLFYCATLIAFYFIFKLRLNLAKLDRDLTDLNRELTLLKKKD
jgi:hypothetical protein